MMLCATKVLRPGLGRIGTLGSHIVLPRTVDLSSLLGATAGSIFGILVGAFIVLRVVDSPAAILGCGMVGGFVGMWLVQWQPWRGENVGRVALVRAVAFRGRSKTVCPGTWSLPFFSEATGETLCPRCNLLVVANKDGLVDAHRWKRRVFIGLREVPSPPTGPIRFVQSSVLTR